jgi:hypothetical protein
MTIISVLLSHHVWNISTVHPAVYINVHYTIIGLTAKRLFLTYRLKIKNYMVTCFGVFIYAIIRPADIRG